MKRIIVCIDGTNNATEVGPATPSPTNVLLFSRALEMTDAAGDPQIVNYLSGVGTDISAGWFGRTWASATGSGLSQLVQQAYGFLTSNYEVRDQVYILGFSRGAAAARSLSGLTELFGILPKRLMHLFPQAWRYYNTPPYERVRSELADAALIAIAARGEQLRDNHISECNAGEDTIVGALSNYPHAPRFPQSRDGGNPRLGTDDTDYVPLPLHFVGVWDTVFHADSEGFHESRLAWNVGAAYQALAIHELRAAFAPAVWERKCVHQHARQTWFPGAHSDVGGGVGSRCLSSTPLAWMVEHANQHGLRFDTQYLSRRDVTFSDLTAPVSFSRWYAKPVFLGSPPETRSMGTSTVAPALSRVPHYRHKTVHERLDLFAGYSRDHRADTRAFAIADHASLPLPREPEERFPADLAEAIQQTADGVRHAGQGLDAVDPDVGCARRSLAAASSAIAAAREALTRAEGAAKELAPTPQRARMSDQVARAMKGVATAEEAKSGLAEALVRRPFRKGLEKDVPVNATLFKTELRHRLKM